MRPYIQFYKDLFPFVITFGLICIIAVGVIWGFVLFITLGLFAGFAGFSAFKKNEYYFYYNLGITPWKLFKVSFLFNLLVGIPLFGGLLIFISFVLGSPTIT